MKVFTVESGGVASGAEVQQFVLKGAAGKAIPAVVIGEEGRGRKLGILPVGIPPTPCPERGQVQADMACAECGQRRPEGVTGEWIHLSSGLLPQRIYNADVGTTQSGRPKLIREAVSDLTQCIVVLRTRPGFRGSTSYTGDRIGWACQVKTCKTGPDGGCERSSCGYVGLRQHCREDLPEVCPRCGESWRDSLYPPTLEFLPMPGKKLCEGVVAQGNAGRMGGGMQYVIVLPRNTVLRTYRGGRTYGACSSHYLVFDGEELLRVTWEERIASDIF